MPSAPSSKPRRGSSRPTGEGVRDSVPAILTLNGQTTAAVPGLTLFEHAERLGVRVPTSCKKQGKCKECLVEVTEGQDALSPSTPEEQHLRGRFRLSCRTTIEGDAHVRCHTMRRGQMRIERRGVVVELVEEHAAGPCVVDADVELAATGLVPARTRGVLEHQRHEVVRAFRIDREVNGDHEHRRLLQARRAPASASGLTM